MTQLPTPSIINKPQDPPHYPQQAQVSADAHQSPTAESTDSSTNKDHDLCDDHAQAQAHESDEEQDINARCEYQPSPEIEQQVHSQDDRTRSHDNFSLDDLSDFEITHNSEADHPSPDTEQQNPSSQDGTDGARDFALEPTEVQSDPQHLTPIWTPRQPRQEQPTLLANTPVYPTPAFCLTPPIFPTPLVLPTPSSASSDGFPYVPSPVSGPCLIGLEMTPSRAPRSNQIEWHAQDDQQMQMQLQLYRPPSSPVVPHWWSLDYTALSNMRNEPVDYAASELDSHSQLQLEFDLLEPEQAEQAEQVEQVENNNEDEDEHTKGEVEHAEDSHSPLLLEFDFHELEPEQVSNDEHDDGAERGEKSESGSIAESESVSESDAESVPASHSVVDNAAAAATMMQNNIGALVLIGLIAILLL
ncbi:hypothetical protein L228DRAFT_244420 [Xylona heveae TC161]|uniref:Uncharacterized protein n=1 Tax=Xylona heveae (strain CBS 132557 / TC161) TaxID=1328760 RepID=A0A161TH41_XYLHT|nr:hypothetical protein L228DRAFT_244420 [Xylona heveae TC161]KZF25557.1 hypothetical protein L228DRAFT_244420 [Xylona heveae TC161]